MIYDNQVHFLIIKVIIVLSFIIKIKNHVVESFSYEACKKKTVNLIHQNIL